MLLIAREGVDAIFGRRRRLLFGEPAFSFGCRRFSRLLTFQFAPDRLGLGALAELVVKIGPQQGEISRARALSLKLIGTFQCLCVLLEGNQRIESLHLDAVREWPVALELLS